MPNEASDVRRRMYEAPEFRAEMMERLNFGTDRVTLPLDALLETNVIPSELDDHTEALAVEGTKILLSICSQVRKSSAMAMVAGRIGAMTLQTELGTPRKKWSTAGFFAADVANLLQKFWEVGRAPRATAIPTVGVSVFWSDPQGRVLFGTIDEWHAGKRRQKKIYSSETLRLPSAPGGEWDFIQLPAVGGTSVSPLPLLGFSELLREGIEDTAADL
jgi:hypothetical protein